MTVRLAIAAAAALLLAAPAPAPAQEPSRAQPWRTLREPMPLPPPAETGRQDVGDVELHYAIYGKGAPVLFLHPGLGHADYWASQIGPLSQTHRVIVVDLRGHGRSTRSDAPLSYELMAGDVMRLIQRQGLGKPTVVGWGDGAVVGLELAMRHPGRIRKLIAHGLTWDVAGQRPGVDQATTFVDYVHKTAADYRDLSPRPDEFDALFAQLETLWAAEPRYTRDQLAAIRTPVAIVAAEHDEWVRLEHMEEAAHLIPDAQFVLLPRSSHFAPWQTSKDFNDVLRLLLR